MAKTKKKHQKPFQSWFKTNKRLAVPVVLVFMVIGTYLTFTSFAAGNLSGSSTKSPSSCGTKSCNPSGQPMPVGDITGWHQVFTDDFTTNVPIGSFPSAVSTKWWDYPDGWNDTSGNGTYMPSQVVSINNGVMDMYLHTVNGVHMVAAPVALLPNRSAQNGVLYGRYAVRFKSNVMPSYKTAWLLWPDIDPPNCNGETDFPEAQLDGVDTMGAFAHWQDATSCSSQNGFDSGVVEAGSGWHTAVTEWTASGINFYMDGNLVGSSTTHIANQSMHWVLQTETRNDSSNPPSNTVSGHIQIDWVAVYRPA